MSVAMLTHAPNAPTAVLARFDRWKMGHAIEVMIALIGAADGHPDAEDDDPDWEHDGREPEEAA